VDPPGGADKGRNRADWPDRRRFQLNAPVSQAARTPTTTYRLAPSLSAGLVGRSLVTLAVLVTLTTVLGLVLDIGWSIAGAVAAGGAVVVALWALYLFRLAWVVRLSDDGYAVRLLRGVGARAAAWREVEEVSAASPGGRPCLVLRLRAGRSTRLPMAALAGDRDAFAHDVRRRVRDAHTAE
jgi:hypothetical protein